MASGRGYWRGYRRSWLLPDGLAALTLLAIAVPEQLATSRLAAMPPVTAYYAFIAGTVMFALLGSNPQMSVGADSTIAPLFAVGIGHLAAPGSPGYIDLVGILAVTVGAIVALVGLFRLGWIAEFLSAPVITGFLAGVAVIIVVHQLPDLLGIPAAGGSTLDRLKYIGQHLSATNGWSLGIGLGVLAVMLAGERLDRRFPGALVGVIASTVVVAGLGLTGHGVVTIGTFSHAAPRWGLVGLSWSALRSVLPLAAVVGLLIVSQSAATTRAFADQGRYDVDVSRDFLGVGAGSVMAGLAGSFPVNASPPRTAAVAEAGGRTQVSGLLAAAALAALIPALGFLKDLPVAALAAVLMFVAARIFHAGELHAIARFDTVEFVLAAVTLLTVAFIGVQQGIGVAVVLAIADRARLSARHQLHVLGRVPGTTSWAPLSGPERAEQVPGVLVVLFATPLWYANAANFRREMDQALMAALGRPRAVVLDAIGMGDIDFTGARALRQVLDQIESRHLVFAVARAGEHVRSNLDRAGLLQRIGENRFYPTVGEAVDGLLG